MEREWGEMVSGTEIGVPVVSRKIAGCRLGRQSHVEKMMGKYSQFSEGARC
jgi:hypothetical protein